MSRILFVASGKGGTGKTSISVNLSLALGRMGRRVCLLDADLGLSNVDVLLGISPELTLEHVLFEGVPMERALVNAGQGVDVVPGGSGVSRLADLTREARLALTGEFAKLTGYDYLVVDGSPGISSQVIALCLACPELLVVVNPDPASITDAYALVKVLSENGLRKSPHLAVNRARSPEYARGIFTRLRGAMAKYLKLDARYLGHVPSDAHVSAASARQKPLMDLYPSSAAGRAFMELARNLDQVRLDPGTARALPAAFLEGAVVRMREASMRGARGALGGACVHDLDEALELAEILGGPGLESDPGRRKAVARLKALLSGLREDAMRLSGSGKPRAEGGPGALPRGMAGPPGNGDADKARREAGPGSKPGPPQVSSPVAPRIAPRIAVICSDPSVGDILAETLGSLGLAVSPPGAGAQAAVVFWRASFDGLAPRLAALGDIPYVYVRGVSSKEVPPLKRPPAEVLDMPLKFQELDQAVRRAVSESVGRRANPRTASTRPLS